jgi:hypothetical protein
MLLLPRGIPVKENIDPGKVNLPDALRKLGDGGFSGYLRFEGEQGTAVVIFEQGKLISALFEAGPERLTAGEALGRIFSESLAGGLRLDIYRLSAELALSIHALLHGDVLFKGQELKLIDIKALLAKLKAERLNGSLRIYTDERIALIFYRDGNPLGFFHDGSTEIETAADTSMSVARLPGAKVDVLAMKGSEEQVLADLADSADLLTLWQRAKERVSRGRKAAEEEASRSREKQQQERRRRMLAFLRGTAERHVGKIGISLVEKEFEKTAGPGCLAEETLAGFYDRLARGAKLVAGPSRVGAMIEEMKRGIKPLLQ